MKKVKYHLRFQVIPDNRVEENAEKLADFCLKHKIEEVVLFIAAEEWNNGLLSEKEEDLWFETIRKAKEILEDTGITVSLNPWMTVLHCDRGRTFPYDRKFKPMVSPLGEESKACASFADKSWQKYVQNLYGRFAKLYFRVMWIEDDFRYHNHSPLTWGGGFEEDVCNRFSKKIGRKVKRKEILEKILQPGPPHPWRSKWLEVWREIQLEVASGIKKEVKKNSKGKTKIGLMSSHPSAHSIEGRRWKSLFNALSIEKNVAHRPHFAFYSEVPGRDKIYSIMMLDIQKKLRPSFCEVAPEIENFPFTVWSKSDISTWADMAFALFFGSDALLLDLFPMTGNSIIDEDKGIGELLDRSYESLLWISNRFSKENNLLGVGVPWKEDASEKVHTEKGILLEKLKVDPLPAWRILLSSGIPASAEKQNVNAIFGNSAWIFDDKEILEMLEGGLLLDGNSAKILCERGFSKYIGLEYKKTVGREDSKYSLEIITNENSGIKKGIYLSVNLTEKFNIFEPDKQTIVWSEVITPEKEKVGVGTTLYMNEKGGKVAVIVPDILNFNFFRQTIMQNLIKYLYNMKIPFPIVSGSPYLFPMYFKGEEKDSLVIFNGGTDSAIVQFEIDKKKNTFGDITILKPSEKPTAGKLLKKGNTFWKLSSSIPYMSFFIMEFFKNKNYNNINGSVKK